MLEIIRVGFFLTHGILCLMYYIETRNAFNALTFFIGVYILVFYIHYKFSNGRKSKKTKVSNKVYNTGLNNKELKIKNKKYKEYIRLREELCIDEGKKDKLKLEESFNKLPKCPLCGKSLVKKSNGWYCLNYPKCSFNQEF
ncbi:MAG: hypothetical protein N4A47_01015 [Clostridia bacterium]|jgi:hypothetical protein|nr:hypothetical protein [Clostridia bacterium]